MSTNAAARAAHKRAYNTARYAANREEIGARQAVYNASHREERAVYNAAYRAAHPEYRAAYRAAHRDEYAAYRAAHVEEIRAYNAAHYLAHPEAHQRADAKRRGATMCEHTSCLVLGATQLAWQTNEHVCYLCGATVWRGVNLNMDHVIPISKGGLHCAENLRPACAPCNLSKRDRMLV